MIVAPSSPGGALNSIDLGNVIATQIEDPLTQDQRCGRRYALWLDPVKLRSFGVAASDVTTALTSQNVQLCVGELGGAPATDCQAINATISASSLMATPARPVRRHSPARE
ncbi:efflux RND transporter permease subunit [Paraburkholderia sp. CNPSo 3272]|uniref:efflux RND transporter permease subunit n=1 Tax=Paraburkholderia sp. CNPSo 3272 TaxID=2940931 RepID=UPI0020B75B86|nr:efflux RND transporter permease subunit [Paraburkholderia sp. CNPSo 3272]MCP3724943.1 efflux RND transporter permease subunit [Paraburkholderia sp. CNPSo 3272]